MAPRNQQGTGQKGHWDKTYTDNPTFFGEGPSEFAYTVPSLFKSAGVRSVLELGCGQGRDTLLFAGEGFQVTALDYSETGLLRLQGSARETGVSDCIATQSFDVRKPLPFPNGSYDAGLTPEGCPPPEDPTPAAHRKRFFRPFKIGRRSRSSVGSNRLHKPSAATGDGPAASKEVKGTS